MGRTPGFLSRAISLLASRASIPDGSTYLEHSFRATAATELHNSSDSCLKEVHIFFQSEHHPAVEKAWSVGHGQLVGWQIVNSEMEKSDQDLGAWSSKNLINWN